MKFFTNPVTRSMASVLVLVVAASAPVTANAKWGSRMAGVALGVVGGAAVAKAANAYSAAQPATVTKVLEGKVIHVEDGDTVKILTADNAQTTIRLSDIDAPETHHGANRPGQPFSNVSKQSLAQMVFGKQVRADCYEIDKYGRSACRIITPDGIDANLEQIRRGMAWANLSNPKFVRDNRAYEIHEQAKAARTGLWAGNPVKPWEWRDTCWKQGQCSGSGE